MKVRFQPVLDDSGSRPLAYVSARARMFLGTFRPTSPEVPAVPNQAVLRTEMMRSAVALPTPSMAVKSSTVASHSDEMDG